MGSLKYIGPIYKDNELFYTKNSIIIYGHGVNGQKIQNILKEKKIDCIFCDKNYQIMGDNVISPSDAIESYSDAEFVVSGKYAVEMFRYLNANHVKSIHMIFI